MTDLILHTDNWLSLEHRESDWRRLHLLWLSSYKSQNTQRNYSTAWHELGAFLNWLTPDQIHQEHIRAWRLLLMQQYDDTTVNLFLSGISSFYRFVQAHYPIIGLENPVKGVKRLPVNPYGKATYLRDDQDMQLLESLEGDSLDDRRDYAMVLFFLTTGIRVSAVTDANISAFRKQGDKVFFVYTNKGGTTDTKEIPPYTYAAITAYLEMRGKLRKTAPLFEYNGNRMHPRHVQRIVQRRCDAVFGKGHGITPHSLRHTAAMNAQRLNSSIADISSLLRHKNLRVTMIYLSHVDKSAGDEVSKRLADRYA